jgi:DNA-binding CsgD family transcriptional regulator
MSDNIAPVNGRYPALTVPGLILIGPAPNQIVNNAEALQILAYPNSASAIKRIGSLLTGKIAGLLKEGPGASNDFAMTDLVSGRRHYRCTRHVLNVQGVQSGKILAILLERTDSPDVTMQELCQGLNLTQRERETVGLLVRGLTSKEIAQHMGISPNTVKSFLRLVMTKAGVSTRTGLIGRVSGIVSRSHAVTLLAGRSGSGSGSGSGDGRNLVSPVQRLRAG